MVLESLIGEYANLVEDSQIPKKFILYQNYPNPFNPITTISFLIPHESQVTLKVYNTVGEKVVTLVDNFLSAGKHSIDWDASVFSSGLYFYRMQAGEFVETKKLLLVK